MQLYLFLECFCPCKQQMQGGPFINLLVCLQCLVYLLIHPGSGMYMTNVNCFFSLPVLTDFEIRQLLWRNVPCVKPQLLYNVPVWLCTAGVLPNCDPTFCLHLPTAADWESRRHDQLCDVSSCPRAQLLQPTHHLCGGPEWLP